MFVYSFNDSFSITAVLLSLKKKCKLYGEGAFGCWSRSIVRLAIWLTDREGTCTCSKKGLVKKTDMFASVEFDFCRQTHPHLNSSPAIQVCLCTAPTARITRAVRRRLRWPNFGTRTSFLFGSFYCCTAGATVHLLQRSRTSKPLPSLPYIPATGSVRTCGSLVFFPLRWQPPALFSIHHSSPFRVSSCTM